MSGNLQQLALQQFVSELLNEAQLQNEASQGSEGGKGASKGKEGKEASKGSEGGKGASKSKEASKGKGSNGKTTEEDPPEPPWSLQLTLAQKKRKALRLMAEASRQDCVAQEAFDACLETESFAETARQAAVRAREEAMWHIREAKLRRQEAQSAARVYLLYAAEAEAAAAADANAEASGDAEAALNE